MIGHPTDTQILRDASKGDEQAISHLAGFASTYLALRLENLTGKYRLSPDLCEDAAQNTLISVVTQLRNGKFEPLVDGTHP